MVTNCQLDHDEIGIGKGVIKHRFKTICNVSACGWVKLTENPY